MYFSTLVLLVKAVLHTGSVRDASHQTVCHYLPCAAQGYYDDALEFIRVERLQIISTITPLGSMGRHALSTRFTARTRVMCMGYPSEWPAGMYPVPRSPSPELKLCDEVMGPVEVAQASWACQPKCPNDPCVPRHMGEESSLMIHQASFKLKEHVDGLVTYEHVSCLCFVQVRKICLPYMQPSPPKCSAPAKHQVELAHRPWPRHAWTSTKRYGRQ